MPEIFDDCEFDLGQNPYLGKQADPIPDVLNGRWTAGPFLWNNRDALTRAMVKLSDVVSFHTYGPPERTKGVVEFLAEQKKPVICMEWLNRVKSTNTFFNHLPYFAEQKISCWNWGCVAGKTLTYLNKHDPEVWAQDVFHTDGTPFDPKEMELLREIKETYKIGWPCYETLKSGAVEPKNYGSGAIRLGTK